MVLIWGASRNSHTYTRSYSTGVVLVSASRRTADAGPGGGANPAMPVTPAPPHRCPCACRCWLGATFRRAPVMSVLRGTLRHADVISSYVYSIENTLYEYVTGKDMKRALTLFHRRASP